MTQARAPRDVAIYLPDLSGGGAERLLVKLAPILKTLGYEPRFLLDRSDGALLDAVPKGDVDVLGASRPITAFPRLIRRLRKASPSVIVVNMEHMAVITAAACALARSRSRLVIIQHNAYSEQLKRRSFQWRVLPPLYRWALRRADAIVAVSHGVAEDLADLTRTPRPQIEVIHNGIVDAQSCANAGPPRHPWFDGDRPVVLAAGRLVDQKDFRTLIASFENVAKESDARLIILGEGPLRQSLESQIEAASLRDRVGLFGFTDNIFGWLSAARLFVLSSRFEGFGNVIVEALSCGTPVVSTRCPFGPEEILENGKFGTLVPVGDTRSMATAILEALSNRPDRDALRARGQTFTVDSCARQYARVFDRVLAERSQG